MYEVFLELDDLLETLTYWLSFAAVALSVIVVAAYQDKRFYVVHFDFDTLVEELDATAIVTGLASI